MSSSASASDERAPLVTPSPRRRFGPIARVHFTSLLMSMTFGFTQTALVYSFKLMTCEDYYLTHPSPPGPGDMCNVPAIDASTARSVAMMSSMTVAGTIVNLFTSAWVISRWGVKAAMFQQTFWAALRNLCQIYAQVQGGKRGIDITIATQVFNALGSGGGFQLCANSFISILAEESERTAQFGILSGVFMLGSGIGFSVGGVLFKYVARLAPFVLAFGFLVFCTVFGMFFLPYIAPEHKLEKKPRQSILAPLAVFLPTKREEGGRNWAMFFLGLGTFLSVLATGYIAMALQLVATNVFGFKPDTSGYMLSLTLVVRAFFLSVCFPRIISWGRRWYIDHPSPVPTPSTAPSTPAKAPKLLPSSHSTPRSKPTDTTDPPTDPPTETTPAETERGLAVPKKVRSVSPSRTDSAQSNTSGETTLVEEERDADGELELVLEPTRVPGAKFDLLFLKYSILLDGVLTSCVSLANRGWHMYAAAVVLPFASGTSPAVKGVILEFAAAALPPSYPESSSDDSDERRSLLRGDGERGQGYGGTEEGQGLEERSKRNGGISNTDKSNVLSGIALIEKFGQVITISLFSYFFALLSEADKPRLIFALDGIIAFLAFAVLLPVQMPRPRRR